MVKKCIGLALATALFVQPALPVNQWLVDRTYDAIEWHEQATEACKDTASMVANNTSNLIGLCTDVYGRCKNILSDTYTFASKHPVLFWGTIAGTYVGWKLYGWVKTKKDDKKTDNKNQGHGASNIVNNITFNQK